jgi:hypothetical protein
MPQTYSWNRLHIAVCVLLLAGLLPLCGCDSAGAPPTQTSQDTRPSLPGPRPNPSRDEASELIRVCGHPDSDTQKPSSLGGSGAIQRIMKWRRYDIEAQLEHNDVDSPKWATTGIFLIDGHDTIDRETLSKRMPCSKKTTLFVVDELFK